MITLDAFFYIMVALFAIIGALRGFKKELLVTAAGVMAVFTMEIVVPMLIKDLTATQLFWISIGVMGVFAILAYQTPSIHRFVEIGLFERKVSHSMLLGGLVGAINGYLYLSTVFHYMAQANYPVAQIIPPDLATQAGQAVAQILSYAVPVHLQGTYVYVGIVLAFICIIGAFV
ncbi:MAG TPA: hypothetical protein DCG78_04670 [Anaerolineaceae bacterium]|jgi:hypothetical protein|nr:MAG: putative membrane protein [Anaerolineae bacterium 49_20]HAE85786.1 hypothetical protein [Anaerolineaceae bacterium]